MLLISFQEAIMTPIAPTIRMMSWVEANQLKLYSRGLILEHHGKSYILNAGTKDKIHVFTHGITFYVLTINQSLNYIGLDAYLPPEQEAINTIFLHSERQIVDVLGRRWKRMSPATMAYRLTSYLI
ncbi:MAG: hypothetical protein ED859_18645 [Desulfuromonadales bacterium]|nr:MAG: hypothetical protein ED859_18645 [Desulfuromonadales bacterium]